MRRFRRKLVLTSLLMGMALVALGLPASAQAVYEQNSSRACCRAQTSCATLSEDAPDPEAVQPCCPGEAGEETRAECLPEAGAESSRCSAGSWTDPAEPSCVPAQGCCTGAQSALGCCQ